MYTNKTSGLTHSHPDKHAHTHTALCLHVQYEILMQYGELHTFPPTHTHTEINTLNTQPKCHAPFGLWSAETSEQPANIESIYFFSAHERDVIPPQIYLVVLWICCRLICMTTRHRSARRRQLRRRYHLYYY